MLLRAAGILRRGGIVAFPTDTVAGVGCLASSSSGVRGIFRLKARKRDKPLILFVRGIAEAERMTGPLSRRVKALLGSCWPGALTAILPLRASLPRGIGRGGTVGIRIPAHPVPRALVRLAGEPLATTSANVSGAIPVRDAKLAPAVLGARVFAVSGVCGRIPSTVADLTVWPPKILRRGAVGARELRRLARSA